MQSLSDEDERRIFQEVVLDELKVIREHVSDLPTRSEFNELKDDVAELKSDMKVVTTVLAEHSSEIKDLQQQVTLLRQAA